MELRICSNEERRWIYEEYLQKDFHQSEVKSYPQIERLVREQRYLCYGFWEQKELQGYAFFVRDQDDRTLLLDYFAVLSAYRSQGLGGGFIRAIQEKIIMNKQLLIAEVENPAYARDDESRELMNRRIGFYRRNGFQISKVCSRVFTDEYKIIYFHESSTMGEKLLATDLQQLYEIVFGEAVCRDQIQIRILEA